MYPYVSVRFSSDSAAGPLQGYPLHVAVQQKKPANCEARGRGLEGILWNSLVHRLMSKGRGISLRSVVALIAGLSSALARGPRAKPTGA